MGSKQSNQISKEDAPSLSHPRFSNCKMIKKGEEQLIEIMVALATESEFKNWESQLKNSPTNQQPYMLPAEYKFLKEGLCGSSGFVQILYPNFPYLLSDEIYNRQSLNNKLFEENELWYLAYSMLAAAAGVHELGRKVGDIRPDNIFINEDGQVKLATVFSWPGQQTNYAKTLYEKETTYLAPEEIKDIHFGKIQASNYEQAETFSIGLSILDAAALENSKNLYNKALKFDYQRLQQAITKFRRIGYSQIFCILVQNMCEIDENCRQTCMQLYRWLRPYEDSIVALEDFQISGIPERLALSHQRSQSSSVQTNSVMASQINTNTNQMQQSNVEPVNASGFQRKSEQIAYQGPHQVAYQNFEQHIPQSQTYIRPTDVAKSSMTLEQIDKQLEASRKMFP